MRWWCPAPDHPTSNLRTVLREHPRRSAMRCWVSPAWRHLRARCWRLSVAQSRTTIGNRTNAATQAARQVIDMAGNALVRQPGRSGLTGQRRHHTMPRVTGPPAAPTLRTSRAGQPWAIESREGLSVARCGGMWPVLGLQMACCTGSFRTAAQPMVGTSCLHLRHHPAQGGEHHGIDAAALELVQLVVDEQQNAIALP